MFMPLIDECFNHEAAVLRGEPWQPKTRQNASNFFSQTIERRAGSRAALLFCSLLRLRLQVAGPVVLWSVRLRGVRRGLVSQALPWHEHSYVDTRALASWSSKNGRALERAQDEQCWEQRARGRDTSHKEPHVYLHGGIVNRYNKWRGLPGVASLCACVFLYKGAQHIVQRTSNAKRKHLDSECCRSLRY